jgi:hypothetical protein
MVENDGVNSGGICAKVQRIRIKVQKNILLQGTQGLVSMPNGQYLCVPSYGRYLNE